MTRHHVITAAIFVLACVAFDHPSVPAIETGTVAAYIAGMYLFIVSYLKVRLNEPS